MTVKRQTVDDVEPQSLPAGAEFIGKVQRCCSVLTHLQKSQSTFFKPNRGSGDIF